MKAAVACPGNEQPQFDSAGVVICSGSGSPEFVPEMGLSFLEWNEVAALNGALLLAVSIAFAYNIVGKALWGK